MSSYIVLARKWRPQTFADLVGQQHIAVTLQNAIMQNRVAHAFLFTGSRGVGKTSSARIFAKALNCEHAPCEEPCNACQSCREITEGRSLDVVEIDGASNRGINEIREVLEAVRYAPSRDRYKIYIIDEVHMLTTEAFNALLKTLEEPPAHVVFIFATTDPNKIPVTILSRCQRYDFKRISNEDLFAHLSSIAHAEQIDFEPSALRLIARTARGGVRDALSAMDQVIAFAPPPITGDRAAEVLGVATRETLTAMVKAILDQDVAKAIACIGRVEHYGQNLALFANDLLEFLRDATVVAAAPQSDIPTELSPAERAEIRSWLTQASIDRFQRLFHIWYQTTDSLSKNLSPRLALEMAAIRMCQVETVVPLDNILERLDVITQALSGHIDLSPDALESVRAYLTPSSSTTQSTTTPSHSPNPAATTNPEQYSTSPHTTAQNSASDKTTSSSSSSTSTPANSPNPAATTNPEQYSTSPHTTEHNSATDKTASSTSTPANSPNSAATTNPEQYSTSPHTTAQNSASDKTTSSSSTSTPANSPNPAATTNPEQNSSHSPSIGDIHHFPPYPSNASSEAPPIGATQNQSGDSPKQSASPPQTPSKSPRSKSKDASQTNATPRPPEPDASQNVADVWNDGSAADTRISSIEWNAASRDIDDDDAEEIDEKSEKMLAVSGDRLKRPKLDSLSQDNPDELLYGWRQIVQTLGAPLSTIMSKAHVNALTAKEVSVSLPRAYRDIITHEHIDDVARSVAKLVAPSCRFSIDYAQKDDDNETLAALQAQRDFEAQQQAFNRIKNSPLFKDVCRRFDVKAESIHFTFNQDRTSS